MAVDETIYHEYVNFKLENQEFLNALDKEANDVYYRFKHVALVLEFLYNELINQDVSEEHENIVFETGFYYLNNQVSDIKDLLNKYFQNDLQVLNKNAKGVNLLLNTYDFQTELSSYNLDDNTNYQQLMKLDQEIIKCFDTNKPIPKKLYLKLDTLVYQLYDDLDVEANSLNTIFLEIAEEYNIPY